MASPLIKLVNTVPLRAMAYEMLDGFGDAKAEWTEDRPGAFHLRRRLNAEEDERVGPAVDCRTTEEAQERYDKIKFLLPAPALHLVTEEVPSIRL